MEGEAAILLVRPAKMHNRGRHAVQWLAWDTLWAYTPVVSVSEGALGFGTETPSGLGLQQARTGKALVGDSLYRFREVWNYE